MKLLIQNKDEENVLEIVRDYLPLYDLTAIATTSDSEKLFSPLTLAEYLGLKDVVEAMVNQGIGDGYLNSDSRLDMDLSNETKQLISKKLEKSGNNSSSDESKQSIMFQRIEVLKDLIQEDNNSDTNSILILLVDQSVLNSTGCL